MREALSKWLSLAWLAAVATAAAADEVAPVSYVDIASGTLISVLSNSSDNRPIPVKAFSVRVTPVTNGEYLNFVIKNPDWNRDRIAPVFADHTYLHGWNSGSDYGDQSDRQRPVTNVSWFAAQAFCEHEGARLPTWYEWEYLAAADANHADARKDPAWRARILAWYDTPTNTHGPVVGGVANYYGVRDMHGLIWEWVEDFNALFISPDSRNQGDPDKLKFCGAGALSLQDKENFAILMRIALLSSLSGADSTDNLGFRCARSAASEISPISPIK